MKIYLEIKLYSSCHLTLSNYSKTIFSKANIFLLYNFLILLFKNLYVSDKGVIINT